MQCEGETRAALYRFYDSRENLLYVGISVDPWRRWREHVLTQPWYPQAKHWAVTWYDSEAEAARAETRAIRRERPVFNIAGAIRPPEARRVGSFKTVLYVCAYWLGAVQALNIAVVMVAAIEHVHPPVSLPARLLEWITIGADASIPVPVIVVIVVTGAPLIYRFAFWLDRNYGDLARRNRARVVQFGERKQA